MNINELAEQVTEEQALDLYYKFTKRFGWAGTLYVREDASNAWHDDDLALTDEQWEAVKASKSWSRFEEYLSEESYDLVRDAISDAKASLGEFTVWVGGAEVNDILHTQQVATSIAKHYLALGYDDIKVVNTTTNIVLSEYEWSK